VNSFREREHVLPALGRETPGGHGNERLRRRGLEIGEREPGGVWRLVVGRLRCNAAAADRLGRGSTRAAPTACWRGRCAAAADARRGRAAPARSREPAREPFEGALGRRPAGGRSRAGSTAAGAEAEQCPCAIALQQRRERAERDGGEVGAARDDADSSRAERALSPIGSGGSRRTARSRPGGLNTAPASADIAAASGSVAACRSGARRGGRELPQLLGGRRERS